MSNSERNSVQHFRYLVELSAYAEWTTVSDTLVKLCCWTFLFVPLAVDCLAGTSLPPSKLVGPQCQIGPTKGFSSDGLETNIRSLTCYSCPRPWAGKQISFSEENLSEFNTFHLRAGTLGHRALNQHAPG